MEYSRNPICIVIDYPGSLLQLAKTIVGEYQFQVRHFFNCV